MSDNMNNKISQLLKEELGEAEAPKQSQQQRSKPTTGNYEKIVGILNNDLINNAAVCALVLGDKEATNRSLFRKKLNRMKNDEGSEYSFSDEELIKINSVLMNLSTQIKQGLSKSE